MRSPTRDGKAKISHCHTEASSSSRETRGEVEETEIRSREGYGISLSVGSENAAIMTQS